MVSITHASPGSGSHCHHHTTPASLTTLASPPTAQPDPSRSNNPEPLHEDSRHICFASPRCPCSCCPLYLERFLSSTSLQLLIIPLASIDFLPQAVFPEPHLSSVPPRCSCIVYTIALPKLYITITRLVCLSPSLD